MPNTLYVKDGEAIEKGDKVYRTHTDWGEITIYGIYKIEDIVIPGKEFKGWIDVHLTEFLPAHEHNDLRVLGDNIIYSASIFVAQDEFTKGWN